MSPLVPIALFGWIPLAIVLFALNPPRRAMVVTFFGGWLFLPVASYSIPGLPDYTKAMAVSLGALLGLLLFGSHHLVGLRFGLHDLPMLLWCLVPAASSLANGNGIYDAVAVTLSRVIEWGIPYLVGRALFRDFATVDYLARCLFLGGLVYVPFCLWEIRMSPQLHATLYGFTQHSFAQHIRQEGYRPLVFMEHGLMVGLWMSVAMVAGFGLWRYGGLRWLARTPVTLLLLVLLVTAVLCKSMGALVLLGAGLLAMAAMRSWRSKLPVYLLVLGPALFVTVRLGLGWQAEGLIEVVRRFAPERASSLWFRIQSEQVFMPGIQQRLWLGWSTWGLDPPAVEDAAEIMTARDSYWLITAMCFGVVGLVLALCIYALPILTLLRRLSMREWLDRRAAGTAVVVVALCLCLWDNMFNAMINPIYTVAIGGLTGLAAAGARLPAFAPQVLPRPRPRRNACLVDASL